MHFLSFETSTQVFSLALNRDGKVLRFRNLKAAKVLENSILPAVDKIIKAESLTLEQMDGFAVALGPGSFTSLRVGLATVKAFAMALAKPVVGIPSLDIIAHALLSFPHALSGNLKNYDEVCVITDARRGKVYAAIYEASGRKSDYLLATLEEVLSKVQGRTLFTGNAVALYRQDIENAYKIYAKKDGRECKCLFAEEKFWYPQARVMAGMAYERFQQKKHDHAETLLPMYLYAQDCQVTSKTSS